MTDIERLHLEVRLNRLMQNPIQNKKLINKVKRKLRRG